MTHSPSDDPNSTKAVKNEVAVQNSQLQDTQIGQTGSGDLTQVAGNLINITAQMLDSSAEESWSREKFDRFNSLKTSFEKEFRDKLENVAMIASELRVQIQEKLSTNSPKDKDTILRLLNELQSAIGHEYAIESIKDELKLYVEASSWLSENMSILAHDITNKVFTQKKFRKTERNRKREQLSTSERLRENFRKDIELYLKWISAYMSSGKTPPKKYDRSLFFETLNLDFISEIYKEAFRAINYELIDPDVSGLDIDVANIIASYINRFLIERNLDRDI